MSVERRKVINGLFWKFSERILAQGVAFVLSIVLARRLLPEEYGIVALVLIFINLANVFVTSGLGDSLVQKQNSDDKDFSTMFICSVVMSLVLYGILFLIAPGIAKFYQNKKLTAVIRILSLQIPLGGVKTIQHAYVTKKMMFKKFFFSTLGGTLISGVVGIILAYNDFGVWALVAQYLTNSTIDMTVLFFTVPWRPHFYFDKIEAKKMFSYGWKLTVAQFLNMLYSNLRNLFIGKIYTEADLAFFNKGDQFPNIIINNVNTSISTVLFPAMAKENGDIQRLRQMTRKSMRMSAYLIFPMMVGLIAVSQPLVRLLLTKKWLPCVPFLCMSCVYWMFQPCQTANAQVIKALGESGIYLKLETLKKIVGILLLIFSIKYGVLAIAVSNVVLAGFSMIVNILPNRHLIDYGIRDQIKDLSPALMLSTVMGTLVFIEQKLILPDWQMLLLQAGTGVSVYLLLSKIFHIEEFEYLLKMIKSRIKK